MSGWPQRTQSAADPDYHTTAPVLNESALAGHCGEVRPCKRLGSQLRRSANLTPQRCRALERKCCWDGLGLEQDLPARWLRSHGKGPDGIAGLRRGSDGGCCLGVQWAGDVAVRCSHGIRLVAVGALYSHCSGLAE